MTGGVAAGSLAFRASSSACWELCIQLLHCCRRWRLSAKGFAGSLLFFATRSRDHMCHWICIWDTDTEIYTSFLARIGMLIEWVWMNWDDFFGVPVGLKNWLVHYFCITRFAIKLVADIGIGFFWTHIVRRTLWLIWDSEYIFLFFVGYILVHPFCELLTPQQCSCRRRHFSCTYH